MHSPDVYNSMLQRAHGRFALRPVAVPARTSGLYPWRREAPLPSQDLRALAHRADPNKILAAGISGRGGSVARQEKPGPDPAWYGPGVM